MQQATKETSPLISANRIRNIQEYPGSGGHVFLVFTICGPGHMAATMSSIVSRQSRGTTKLEEEVKQFFDYCMIHPNTGVKFIASDMLLALHLDASYFLEQEAKSRAAAHFYLGKHNDEDFNNGDIMTLSKTMKHIMPSALEAETAVLFYNCKAASPL